MCRGVLGRRPTSSIASVGQRWVIQAAAGALLSAWKLLTPVRPGNKGRSQHEMFYNTVERGGAFPGKWQCRPDVSQGN